MMLAPIVTKYLKKGRVCVPLKDNSKEPFTKDHLNKTFSVEEFKTNSFGTNLEKSNECFVDCDSEYASRLVASFFPITETTKVGTRITHYTYKGRYTATALKFPDKTTIAELRNVGLQVKAPSFAPAKLYGNKVMQRETNGFDPVEAPADMIERWNKFCFASLCLRYIDSNNLPFVKLTQCLKHYTDWNDSAITEYVKVIADACEPKHAFDWKDIRHKVSSALKAYDNKNEKAFGYKSLSEEFGVDVNYMRKAIGWIGEVKPDNARKTVVNFKAEALTEEKMNSEVKMEYLIGQILPKAGLVILAGPPKSGKSNLITDLCFKLCKKWNPLGLDKNPFLGTPIKERGDVLYLALEDSDDTMTIKIQKMKVEKQKPKPDIYTGNQCPCIGKGLEESIVAWKASTPAAKMVVIDTFQKIKPLFTTKSANAYEVDYHYLSKLHGLAKENDLLIIYLHHLAKQTASNKATYSWDKIMGSVGHQGVPDVMWMLERDEHGNRAVFRGRGRVIPDFEMELNWNAETFRYEYGGSVKGNYVRKNNKEIYGAMGSLHMKHGADHDIFPKDVCKVLSLTGKKDTDRIRKNMIRLRGNGDITSGEAYGSYRFVGYKDWDIESGEWKNLDHNNF